MRCVLLTTAAWGIAGSLLLLSVLVISDYLFGRGTWTLDSYRRDGAPPQERSR